jgi:NAD(P)-dependent dehydrogenase (short-subunit alcohol dehydrogenase family)
MNLKGRRALVTGAAGGIARVICQTLAELGANLVLVDRPDSDCGALADVLQRDWGVEVRAADCDLELERDRSRLIESMEQEGGGLDVLINNAAFLGTTGLEGWVRDFERQSVETWRRALEVNLTAAFDLTEGFRLLRQSPGGSIINIASIYG